jgi:hypothetical protein
MPGNFARNAGGAREWREAREVRGCRGGFGQGYLRRSRRDGCDDYLEYDRDEAARTPGKLRPGASRHQGARCPTYRRGERGAFPQPRPLGVRQRLGRHQGTPRSRRTIGTGGHSGTLRGSLAQRWSPAQAVTRFGLEDPTFELPYKLQSHYVGGVGPLGDPGDIALLDVKHS